MLDGVARTTVEVDPQRITQALLQLADNAVRHTAAGDEIGIGSRLHEGNVELWVRDTGSGVSPALRETIFERFSQGEDEHAGFGLGLSIVAVIARAHEGQVVLDEPSADEHGTSDHGPTSGTGATFRLVVPAGGQW